MYHPTQIRDLDLPTFRSSARAVLQERVLPRYDDVVRKIGEQRATIAVLSGAIDAYLEKIEDPATEAAVRVAREAAQTPLGPGLQSADDLCKRLASAVLILSDIAEITT